MEMFLRSLQVGDIFVVLQCDIDGNSPFPPPDFFFLFFPFFVWHPSNLISFFLSKLSQVAMYQPKGKASCHPLHYRVRFFSLLSDPAVLLCRLFLVKHVEMHNLFELILGIEDRATSIEDAGCSCIVSLYSVGLCLR